MLFDQHTYASIAATEMHEWLWCSGVDLRM